MSLGITINAKFVREVIATQLTDGEIEGAISTALVFYSNTVGKVPNSGIGPDLELEIKRYLAAHMVTLKDPSTRVTKEKIGEAHIEYDNAGHALGGDFFGLKATRWGQTAMMFDTTGTLKNIEGIPPRWYSI